MCKRTAEEENVSKVTTVPLFKPFSAFKSKQFVKKMAQKIYHTLNAIEINPEETLPGPISD